MGYLNQLVASRATSRTTAVAIRENYWPLYVELANRYAKGERLTLSELLAYLFLLKWRIKRLSAAPPGSNDNQSNTGNQDDTSASTIEVRLIPRSSHAKGSGAGGGRGGGRSVGSQSQKSTKASLVSPSEVMSEDSSTPKRQLEPETPSCNYCPTNADCWINGCAFEDILGSIEECRARYSAIVEERKVTAAKFGARGADGLGR